MTAPDISISYFEIICRLSLATLFGGLIGIEREKISRFAGLRTHMLVCIGSALIMIVSQYGFHHILQRQNVILDPSRIAAQVVSGIGFLGAGTILFYKEKIRGLTTAASLWAVAGLGLSVGGGLYFVAFTAAILIFIVLAVLKPLENRFFRNTQKDIRLLIKPRISLVKLEEILTTLNLSSQLKTLQIQTEHEEDVIYLVFNFNIKNDCLKLADEIKNIPGIEKIEILE
ncbi:MgtC/SapB family protein [Candidatus Protochlamydia phocaeensis]|uniref:MgtC/SapB family protein n=1 Tax=Candidatus Protochlamydia phocaeensis TaxID=1414722 RepID=UPI000838DE07|nr:MgtC/SapB family protein [Candidatus Protochlamydia phocaeensis]